MPGDLAWFRYLLVALAVAWALVVARARPGFGLLAGCAFVVVAVGFWVLAFGRPYGFLEEPGITRRAAEAGVRAWARPGEGVLAGAPADDSAAAVLASVGMPPALIILAPTLLPVVIVPALAVLIHLSWPARRHASLAALVWLAFSTGDLDALRGLGVVSGMWARPGAALALVASVAAVFLATRVPRPSRAWIALAALLSAGWWLASAPFPGIGAGEAVLALTLDQGLWLPLGGYGLVRRGEPASRTLAAAGALVVLASALPFAAPDPWGGHALYRVGLLLAAAAPVSAICTALGERLSRRVRVGAATSAGVGAAVLLLALVPASFLTWWDPSRLDPNAAGSLPPLQPEMVAAMHWVRRQTPDDAVFLASPRHAPLVAALGGRRVLRAPTVAVPPDDGDRRQAEARILYGHTTNRLARRYGVSHVLLAPGDFGEYWLGVEDLQTRGPFRLLYRGGDAVSVYEVPR